MPSCVKTLQIFYYDVKHFLLLYKIVLVFDTLSLPPCGPYCNNPARGLWPCFGEGWVECRGPRQPFPRPPSSLAVSWRERVAWEKMLEGLVPEAYGRERKR